MLYKLDKELIERISRQCHEANALIVCVFEYQEYVPWENISQEFKDSTANSIIEAILWMKYESQGSFRLNKVARDILVRYCPFAKDIRQGLATNPQYQNAFHRLDAENRKKLQRFRSVYDKYEAAGGEITPELKENLRFYQM
jgi:hypothetical protein